MPVIIVMVSTNTMLCDDSCMMMDMGLVLQYAFESQIRLHDHDPATSLLCMEPREVSFVSVKR